MLDKETAEEISDASQSEKITEKTPASSTEKNDKAQIVDALPLQGTLTVGEQQGAILEQLKIITGKLVS